jgi:hypothetical protein
MLLKTPSTTNSYGNSLELTPIGTAIHGMMEM